MNPLYARLWAGQAVSAAGDSLFTVTAVWWVFQQIAVGRPWAAAAVSGIPAAAYGAVALSGFMAAAVVDRFDRRSLMAATEMTRTCLAGALAAASFVPSADLPPAAWLTALYVTVAALNAAGQVFVPARIAVTAEIVPGDADRVRAAGLGEAATSAAGILGPVAAMPLILTAGVHAALLVNAASYAVSWLSVRSLPSSGPGRPGRGLRAELAEGVRAFTAGHLPALLAVTMTCQLGTGTVTALNSFAVVADLHGTPRMYLVAELVMGGGYITGAAAAGRLVSVVGVRVAMWSGLIAAGFSAAGYALARDVPVGLAAVGSYAIAIAVLNTSAAPLLMSAAPREVLGRVMAVFGPANQSAAAASVLLSGWLAGTLRGFRAVGIGPVSLVLLIGSGLIFAAGVLAVNVLPRSPALARPAHNRPQRCRLRAARRSRWRPAASSSSPVRSWCGRPAGPSGEMILVNMLRSAWISPGRIAVT